MKTVGTFKIIEDINGAFSSRVQIVETSDGVRYVLKQTPGEIFGNNHKESIFHRYLKKIGLPFLDTTATTQCLDDQFLLSYLPGSVQIGDLDDLSLYYKFGQYLKQVHTQTFSTTYKIENNAIVEFSWNDAISHLQEYSKAKITNSPKTSIQSNLEHYMEAFEQAKKVEPVVTMIHGDMHTGNVLIYENDLYIFDPGSFMVTGDYRYDIATVATSLASGLVKENNEDRQKWNSFLEGYGEPNLFQNKDFRTILKMVCARQATNPFLKDVNELFKSL